MFAAKVEEAGLVSGISGVERRELTILRESLFCCIALSKLLVVESVESTSIHLCSLFENSKMNRLIGGAKKKAPPPNLADAIGNVDSRSESIEKKIAKLEDELTKYKELFCFSVSEVCFSLLSYYGLTKRTGNGPIRL